jgi:hypothetical protein
VRHARFLLDRAKLLRARLHKLKIKHPISKRAYDIEIDALEYCAKQVMGANDA